MKRVKISKRAVVLQIACVCLIATAAGCSNDKPVHDTAGMGAMPTAPPGGNPYAPGTPLANQMSAKAQEEFVAKLATLSPSERVAFIRENSTTMTSIQSGPDSPIKQKLTEALAKH